MNYGRLLIDRYTENTQGDTLNTYMGTDGVVKAKNRLGKITIIGGYVEKYLNLQTIGTFQTQDGNKPSSFPESNPADAVNANQSSGGSGTGGAIQKGDAWQCQNPEGFFINKLNVKIFFKQNDIIYARTDNPGQDFQNWELLDDYPNQLFNTDGFGNTNVYTFNSNETPSNNILTTEEELNDVLSNATTPIFLFVATDMPLTSGKVFPLGSEIHGTQKDLSSPNVGGLSRNVITTNGLIQGVHLFTHVRIEADISTTPCVQSDSSTNDSPAEIAFENCSLGRGYQQGDQFIAVTSTGAFSSIRVKDCELENNCFGDIETLKLEGIITDYSSSADGGNAVIEDTSFVNEIVFLTEDTFIDGNIFLSSLNNPYQRYGNAKKVIREGLHTSFSSINLYPKDIENGGIAQAIVANEYFPAISQDEGYGFIDIVQFPVTRSTGNGIIAVFPFLLPVSADTIDFQITTRSTSGLNGEFDLILATLNDIGSGTNNYTISTLQTSAVQNGYRRHVETLTELKRRGITKGLNGAEKIQCLFIINRLDENDTLINLSDIRIETR